jgi:hypothetical protein
MTHTRRFASSLLFSVLATLLSARAAIAQSDTIKLVVPSRRIAPGDTSLRPGALRSDTLTYALTAYRDGAELQVGTIRDELTRTMSDKDTWVRVLSVQRSAAKLVDSTVSELATLSPRQHRSSQPTRLMRIDIRGTRVRGTLGPIDGPGVAIDTTLKTPFFDSGNWDLVVRSMPLAPGYEAVFRVYDLDTGLKDYIVRVVGATTLHGESAHVVQFRLGAGSEATVWIGSESKRLLQVETVLGPTTMLRQTLRVAPR